MDFSKWLDTLIEEKGIDVWQPFTVEGPSGPNYMNYQNVVYAIKVASANEQNGIKTMLVRIDFANGDIRAYFRHLAQAIAI